MKRVRAAGFSDRPFTVMRTWADPRMVDPTLEPTKRPPNTCYAGEPVKANRSSHGIAAACTLRNWLGMWSLRHAQTRAEPHLAPDRLPGTGDQRRAGHGRVPVGRAAHLRRAGQHRQDPDARSTPTTTSPRPGRAASRRIPSPSGSPNGGGDRSSPTSFPARRYWNFLPRTVIGSTSAYCGEDDDDTFYRELPDAEVIWHVLRPLSASDLRQARRLRLVHKLGAGVNTDRRGRRDVARHRGGQHAGRERAIGRRGHGAADAGRAAPARRAGPLDPVRRGMADRSVARRNRARHRRLHGRAGGLRQHRAAGRDDRRGDGRRRAAHQYPRRRHRRLASASGIAGRQ